MHLKNKIIYKIGFWSSLFAFIGAIGFVISVVILQAFHLVSDLWVSIIGFGTSLIIPVPFLLAMLVLHYTVPEEKRFWTHAALLFGVIYASYVIQNYVVQLVSVIPAMLHGSLGTLDAFNQTPHSFLWDLDALGYMFMDAIPNFV